jgi:hypothetical protein
MLGFISEALGWRPAVMLTSGYFPHHGSSLIDLRDVRPDPFDDILGAKIRRMQKIEGWTSEKRRLQHDLEAMSAWFGYVGWTVDPRTYLVHQVGQSFLYDVPVNKRGNFAIFRGMRVRVICLGSGAFTRWVRVGPLNPLDIEAPSPEVSVHRGQEQLNR